MDDVVEETEETGFEGTSPPPHPDHPTSESEEPTVVEEPAVDVEALQERLAAAERRADELAT